MSNLVSRFHKRLADGLRLLPFLFLMVALSPAPALADGGGPPENINAWGVKNLGQCNGILNYGLFYLNAQGTLREYGDTPIIEFSWSGGCNANGLIDGNGTIVIWQRIVQGNFSENNKTTWRGRATNGIMEGPWQGSIVNLENDNVTLSRCEGMAPGCGESWTTNVSGGCETEFIADGCNKATGIGVRDRYLAGKGVTGPAKVAPTPQPVEVTPQPAPSNGGSSKTLDTVASGLMSVLGAGGGANFSSGDAMIDAIVKSVAGSLTSGGGADKALLNNVLSAVRSSLAGNFSNATTGQLVDLVTSVVRTSLASARPSGDPQPLTMPTPVPPLPLPSTADRFSTDAQSVFAAFGRIGQSVVWDTPTSSGPLIKQAANQYLAYLYDCANGGVCTGMQLLACYTYPNASMAKANDWNRGKLQGRAFINSSGNLCIDQYVDFSGGLLDDQRLKTIFDIYYTTLGNAPVQFNSP